MPRPSSAAWSETRPRILQTHYLVIDSLFPESLVVKRWLIFVSFIYYRLTFSYFYDIITASRASIYQDVTMRTVLELLLVP